MTIVSRARTKTSSTLSGVAANAGQSGTVSMKNNTDSPQMLDPSSDLSSSPLT